MEWIGTRDWLIVASKPTDLVPRTQNASSGMHTIPLMNGRF